MGESYSLAIVWYHFFGQRALVKADALSVFEWGELGSCIIFGVVIAFCGFVFSLFCS